MGACRARVGEAAAPCRARGGDEGLALDRRDGGDRRHLRRGRSAGRVPSRGGQGLPFVTRIAVDGIDAAGKTTLADQLGALLKAQRVCIDDFLRPEDERYARGVDSPEGYYEDSFD